MDTHNGLQRFTTAQQDSYEQAAQELRQGRKRSHWMWYIFPQLRGLGVSETARFYGINNREEAAAYLAHPVLGERLTGLCNILLQQDHNDAHAIFGSPDDLKLRSCMTLFAALPDTDPVFDGVLRKFFDGQPDAKTLKMLGA